MSDRQERGAAGGVSRAVLAVFYMLAGAAHLLWPEPFLAIMPEAVPFPRAVVTLTGLAEIAGAAGLLTARLRRAAGLLLALYAVCVFPANIKHAMIGGEFLGWPLDWRYHAPRLLLQPMLVWWAIRAGGWLRR
jgi:uncharacterized membrane protein